MNGMEELLCLMIEKVNPEVRQFKIEYLVFSLRSFRHLMIIHKPCDLFL